MTDEEHEKMVEVGNEFWLEFSALCEKYIDKAPDRLRDRYAMYLDEKTSVYGRKKHGP